ncbi:hypothetical protein GA830_15085 [Mesorhizobium sp. NBSH29]|uniref:hypothetical protein n=1 Tax=Mesorhizobium sp. NBSH29 TaxID=2654249 RepID=UPI00189654D6|nr:hypothetical protein [Mesorhizobium sp. NBSH29]QPC87923.1 hypothetical protein GA830_15085 [Mesorhizobium sp. NBSH29]
MSLKNHIEAFFASVAHWGDAIGEPSFIFAAVKNGERFEVTQARLLVGTITPFAPFGFFTSDNVRAGHFLLSDVRLSPEQYLERVLQGVCPTPNDDVYFGKTDSGIYQSQYQPFHPDGMARGERISVVTLLGRQLELQPRVLSLDWELKGATDPYDSLQELYGRFGLSAVRTDIATVEVAALGILAVDLFTSITGTECEVAVRMSKLGNPKLVGIGYRILNGNQTLRGRIETTDLEWTAIDGGLQRGAATITVPNAAVVQAYASYAGTVLHQAWINDPTTGQSPRRAAYAAFDHELAILRDLLSKPPGRGNARELEAGVSWLLWMLGFSPAHLGNTTRLQEAPDIVATTPFGHVVVVECTTGLLKTENKLSLLVERSATIRERLVASGNQHLRVLPAIVTTKRLKDVRADLEQAQRLGVLVITEETLTEALPRTLFRSDADQVFAEGEQAVADNLAKYPS